jgi:hypothetical protein
MEVLDNEEEEKRKRKEEEEKKIAEQKRVSPPENPQTELDSILRETQALTPDELKEKKENAPIEFQNGSSTSIREVNDYIEANRQPYKPHFGYDKPFYKNIYRLKGWPDKRHKDFDKPDEVALITLMMIYNQFPEGVVQHLKRQNKMLFAYIRKDKYFQFLSKEGLKQLDLFIEDFISMSIGYDEWDKFEEDYCAKNKLKRPPYMLFL